MGASAKNIADLLAASWNFARKIQMIGYRIVLSIAPSLATLLRGTCRGSLHQYPWVTGKNI
jgi:hypothetical protein